LRSSVCMVCVVVLVVWFACLPCCALIFFFFNRTVTADVYTLSLHDALPILTTRSGHSENPLKSFRRGLSNSGNSDARWINERPRDRKSTRLNSSHQIISYAVFCLKKKKE